MAEVEPSSPKRIKLDNSVCELHVGQDSSSPNTKLVVSINRILYLDEKTADIHFLCETNGGNIERVPAHKLIVTTGSSVFEKMFYGSIHEGNEIKISNGNSASFKEFLQFFYLDELRLTIENIADVMNFVRQYGIERCMAQCVEFLKDVMTNDDVCASYQLALQFELDELKRFCERKISGNAEDVLKTDDFLNCDRALLQYIVKMHSLMCEEKIVFDACVSWAKKSCEKSGLDPCQSNNLRAQLMGGSLDILHLIHFNRMNIQDFASRNAKYEGIFTLPEVTEIIQTIVCKEFNPSLFTVNPLCYEIFTWDDRRISEISLLDQLRKDNARRGVLNIESIILSCNKPIILHKMKFAAVSSKLSEKIEIFQILPSNGSVSESLLLVHTFDVTVESNVFVEFEKPILIHPKASYKIRLTRSSKPSSDFGFVSFKSTSSYGRVDSTSESPKMEYGEIEVGDLKLNLAKSNSNYDGFTLLSAIYFNKI